MTSKFGGDNVYIKSLCCIPKTNTMLYVSYNTIFKKAVFPWKSVILIHLIKAII